MASVAFAPTSPAGARSIPSAADLDHITQQSESRGQRYGRDGHLLRSPAGAMGEMQVMPGTARDPGYGVRAWDGRSPDDLARVGRDYRAAMEAKYQGDPALMWSAYNLGPGRTDKLVARHGPNWLSYAPSETRNYVQRNMRQLRGL